MNAQFRFFAAVAVAAALAACASPTPYQPRHDGFGYHEQRLEPNRYRVSFIGNSATPRETVENYLLYRAAELTLKEGKDYFVMVGRDTEAHVSGSDPGYGGVIGTGFGWGHRGTFTGLTLGGGPRVTRYEAHADIVLHEGKKPADNPRAYSARDLMANLEPMIARGDIPLEPPPEPAATTDGRESDGQPQQGY